MKPTVRYLCRRGETYQLRFPIPKDLQRRFGRKELRWSLETKNLRMAELRVWRSAIFFDNLCSKVRIMKQISEQQIRTLVANFFEELKASYQPPPALSAHEKQLFDLEQEVLSTDAIDLWKHQLLTRQYESSTIEQSKQVIDKEGYVFEDLTPAQLDLFLQGFISAQIEFQSYVKQKSADPLHHYVPPAFLNMPKPEGAKPLAGISQTTVDHQNGMGGQLSDLTEEFIQHGIKFGFNGKKPWKTASIKRYCRNLPWFVELVGAKTDIRDVTMAHVTAFRVKIQGRPKDVQSGTSFNQISEADIKNRVSSTTARNDYQAVCKFLRWCEGNGYVLKAPIPLQGIGKASVAESEKRRPFNNLELNKLFTSPMFRGCKSRKFRHIEGKSVYRDDQFWAFLLLFFTGARCSDIAALRAGDIDLESDIPNLHFKMRNNELKDLASERKLPIPSRLLELKFTVFCEEKKKLGSEVRLFNKLQTKQLLGQQISKVLNRYRIKIGLNDPLATIHSFRHGMKDALLEIGCPEEIAKRILGHALNTPHANYGKGPSLKAMREWIDKADMGLNEETWKVLKPSNTKD